MLTPVKAPLECFGLWHDPKSKICTSCEHAPKCRTFMGNRLQRIPVSEVRFRFVPENKNIVRHWEKNPELRDIEGTYTETYKLVFGCDPNDQIGKLVDKLASLAKETRCSPSLFVAACMFAHLQSSPDTTFTSRQLVDDRARHRVLTYAESCRERYGNFDIKALSMLTGSHLQSYDLRKRMLDSEVAVGCWIIDFKLFQPGLPYGPLFEALENKLDPNWLAVEPHYEPTLKEYSVGDREDSTNETRHLALVVYHSLKKHRHKAIGNFRARELIMPQAVSDVLEKHGYAPGDFEIENKAVTDALNFWKQLALAIQHFECLKLVNLREGIYA